MEISIGKNRSGKTLSGQVFHFLLGLLLAPFAVGFCTVFFNLFKSLKYGFAIHPALIYGFLAYLVIHFIFYKPLLAYNFGHELTHGLWSMLFGGGFSGLRIGRSGGRVKVSRSNVPVALAPYFFPLYALNSGWYEI